MSEAVFKAFSGGRSLAAENRALNAMSVPQLVATYVAGFPTKAAAAAALGIHPSTLRRWSAGSTSPRANRPVLINAARAARRRALMGPRKEKKLRGKPDWSLTGRIYVRSGKDPRGDDRRRTIDVGAECPTGALGPAVDAFLAGDDPAAAEAVAGLIDTHYVAGMAVAPGEVEALSLGT